MNNKKIEFSKDEINNMIQLHNEGMTNIEIGKLYKVSKSKISRIFKEYNVPSRHPMLTDKRKNEIIQCYLECRNKAEVERKLHVNTKTITNILKENDIEELTQSQVRQKYSIDETYFDVLDTAEKCYYFGLLMADGYLNEKTNTLTLALQIRDIDIIRKFNDAIGSNRPIKIKKYSLQNSNWSDQAVLYITNEHIRGSLVKNGLRQNKSLTVEFPQSVPEKFYPAFILGYQDGDGHYSSNPKDKRVNFVGTEQFCLRVRSIVKDLLNINSSIMYSHGEKEKPTRVFQIAGNNQVKKYLDWLYDNTPVHLERKYKIYLELYCNINNSLSA